jgi:hypothetical protein
MEEQSEQPEHPIRYYELMEQVFEEMETMTGSEIRGATKVMSIIADYFWDLHFNSKQVLDQKAFVKTIDEIRDNLFDAMYYEPALLKNSESK